MSCLHDLLIFCSLIVIFRWHLRKYSVLPNSRSLYVFCLHEKVEGSGGEGRGSRVYFLMLHIFLMAEVFKDLVQEKNV